MAEAAFENLKREIVDPGIEYRPELRWWLSSGHHTAETLRYEIQKAYEAGFGGMEFLAMEEDGIDNARYGWGSEEWVYKSKIIVEETTRRGMSVSFTSGTNWSNANLPISHITPEHPAAAKELDFVYEDLDAGSSRSGAIPKIDLDAIPQSHGPIGSRGQLSNQSLVLVVAARITGNDGGKEVKLDPDTVVLTNNVKHEELEWTAPTGKEKWRIFYAYMHGTGQTAIPSASTNYTINYLDKDGSSALIDYWRKEVLTEDLREIIGRSTRVQMYMDSLELSTYGQGGIFWGHKIEKEFEERRGYSLAPYLPFLFRKAAFMIIMSDYLFEPYSEEAKEIIEKVRFDLVKTYTDLYIENMLRPFRKFLNENNITLRSEISYGLPFELSRPGPEVDGIETESLEFGSQIDGYRLLSGVAHLFNKTYSSETGATTRNMMLPHLFYDQIINTQFAAGIQKMVLHGWASMCGKNRKWPGYEGMWKMYSERFDTRQPGFEFYPLWTKAMARMQMILRKGKPRVDIGILRTDHRTDNLSGLSYSKDGFRVPDEEAYGKWWMRNRENHWRRDLGMQDAGWTYEFFDGSLLLDKRISFDGTTVQEEGPGYQALIVFQSSIDPDVAKKLLEWVEKGLKLLIVDNSRELFFLRDEKYTHHPNAAAMTPGRDNRDKELAAIISQLEGHLTVKRIENPNKSITALRELDIKGRAEFEVDNQNILTHMREEDNLIHLYLYHMLYETGSPTKVTVCLEGKGWPFILDKYRGSYEPNLAYKFTEGRTLIEVPLEPGESAVVTLVKIPIAPSSGFATEPKAFMELKDWNLIVESWGPGEIESISEDRGLGYMTTEDRPHTKVTKIEVGQTKLVPWKDISQVGEGVSGVGEYRTTVEIEKDLSWREVFIDLGSTAGGLGSISVNGSEPVGFDTSVPRAEITGLLRKGQNEIIVRVASSLNNRLKAEGYYDPPAKRHEALMGVWKEDQEWVTTRDYGLLGPVKLYIL